jgi:photosystem II stability/assembly factor-like uncharacterized protein
MKSDMDLPDSLQHKKISLFDVGRIDSLRGEWLAATLISRFNSRVVYHGLQHLYRSADGGESWQLISPDLSYQDTSRMGKYPYLIYHQAITAIAEGSRPGILYAGTDDGKVWRSLQDGKDWTDLTQGLPYNKHVAKIATGIKNPDRVYLVLNDRRQDNHTPYLYSSDDQGIHWIRISGDLPASPVNVVAEDPRKNGYLYCGTDMGIYMSKNNGRNWIALNGNLPAAVSVNDLFFHPRDQKLVIGTYGRGVYILDSLSLLP